MIVTFGADLGWTAGDAVGVALGTTIAVAVLGLLLVRRLPGRPPPVAAGSVVAAPQRP